MSNTSMMRTDNQFKELLNEVRTKRRQLGKDKRDLSDRRLTLAISRIQNIEKVLIESNIKEEQTWKEVTQ